MRSVTRVRTVRARLRTERLILDATFLTASDEGMEENGDTQGEQLLLMHHFLIRL